MREGQSDSQGLVTIGFLEREPFRSELLSVTRHCMREGQCDSQGLITMGVSGKRTLSNGLQLLVNLVLVSQCCWLSLLTL